MFTPYSMRITIYDCSFIQSNVKRIKLSSHREYIFTPCHRKSGYRSLKDNYATKNHNKAQTQPIVLTTLFGGIVIDMTTFSASITSAKISKPFISIPIYYLIVNGTGCLWWIHPNLEPQCNKDIRPIISTSRKMDTQCPISAYTLIPA